MTAPARVLVAMLAWGALAFGATYPWAYWPLGAVALGMGITGLRATTAWQSAPLQAVAIALAAVAIAIAVQLVPLPYAAFRALSPAGHDLLNELELSYGLNLPSWHALSLYPAMTAETLVLFVVWSVFCVGLASAFVRWRLEGVVQGLVMLGVVLAVAGVIQKAAMGEEPLIYGFWKPTYGGNPFGPFYNRNHFAGWMVMAVPVALGYACWLIETAGRGRRRAGAGWLRWATSPDASRFMLVGLSVLGMAAALVITGSRSGIGAFGLAMAVFGALVVMRLGAMGRRLAVAGLAALFGGAIIWAGTGSTIERFSLVSADLPGRISAWRDTLRIIADFPWFGTGVGTYGQAMLAYQTGERHFTYMQAHNDYLQIVAEGGLLVAVPVVIAIIMIVRAVARRWREDDRDALTVWVRAGAVAGLVGIAAQSLFEYSLQRPGVAVLFAVLLALALHRSSRRSGDHAHRV